MGASIRHILLCAVSIAGLSQPLSAQPAADNGADPDRVLAALDATDIIVTAQRRSQRLQDVPIAISALGEAVLTQANVTSAVDIGKVVPSVIVQPALGSVLTFVRGIGNNQPTLGNEAANAVYIDGVYISRLSSIALKLNDVERVEVLRGPQGTLFGRNSESGLLQIITRTPSPEDDPQGRFEIGYGNFQTIDASGYVSSGLGSKAALSASFAYKDQGDGFGTNRVTGRDHLKAREYAGRAKLVLKPGEATTITLAGDYSHSKSDIGLAQLYRVKGATEQNPGGQTGLPPDGLVLAPQFGFYDSTTDNPHYFRNSLYGGSIKAEQDLGFAQLVDTLAYRHSKESLIIDVDLTAVPFARLRGDGTSKQITNELQLISNPGQSIEWAAGLYYFNNKFGYDPFQLAGPLLGAGPDGTVRQISSGKTESYAGYGQATVKLPSDFRLTVGARYTHIDLKADNRVDFLVGSFIAAPLVPPEQARKKFDKATWKVVVDYKPGDTLYYASASTGYKDGLFNIGSLGPLGSVVKPETLNAYEVGVKGKTPGRGFSYQFAAFYYRQKDPQVYLVINNATSLINAGKASVKGVEGEINAAIGPNLSLRASAAYLDAKYTDFKNAPFYDPNPLPPFGLVGPIPRDASGVRLPRAPKFSTAVGFEYRIPVESGQFALAGNYNYVSRFYFDPDHLGKSGKYSLVDGELSYRLDSTDLKIALWGSNLLNEKFYVQDQEVVGYSGLEGVANEPRRYGVRLTYAF